jgi:hypothetical protein
MQSMSVHFSRGNRMRNRCQFFFPEKWGFVGFVGNAVGRYDARGSLSPRQVTDDSDVSDKTRPTGLETALSGTLSQRIAENTGKFECVAQ